MMFVDFSLVFKLLEHVFESWKNDFCVVIQTNDIIIQNLKIADVFKFREIGHITAQNQRTHASNMEYVETAIHMYDTVLNSALI